jgi:hypothetical protein
LMYSWKRCASPGEIFSCATRRTEVRRSTLKRAPRGTRRHNRVVGTRRQSKGLGIRSQSRVLGPRRQSKAGGGTA